MAELTMQEEGSTPSTPSAGKWKIYPKSDGLYLLDDAGLEIGPFVKGGSGTYTPTLTNGANVAASTPYACQYMRVGNMVMVSGILDVDPTAGSGTATRIDVSLPIASNLATAVQLAGAMGANAATESAQIFADETNNRAAISFLAQTTANHSVSFMFMYQVL
jgi:hypothetical protein